MSGAAATKSTVLTLYKNLLREAGKFEAYNYRNYALRRTRDAFRSNKSFVGEAAQSAFKDGIKNLEVLKRQVIVGQMYTTDKLIIEK